MSKSKNKYKNNTWLPGQNKQSPASSGGSNGDSQKKKATDPKAEPAKTYQVPHITMHLCPVCGGRKWNDYSCRLCGYDASRDYSTYPTLVMIPAGTDSLEAMQEHYRKKQLEKEEAERRAREQKQMEELKSQLEAIYDDRFRRLESDIAALKRENDALNQQVTSLTRRLAAGHVAAAAAGLAKAKSQTTTQTNTGSTSKSRTTTQTSSGSSTASTGTTARTNTGSAQASSGADIESDLRRQFANGATEITFGRYLQEGNKPEPIRWIVLTHDKDGVLLLSKYLLDTIPYHMQQQDNVTWENSDIRRWLSQSFLKAAFSEEEQKYIWNLHIKDGDRVTTDKLFLLSAEEKDKYVTIPLGKCQTTAYSRKRGGYARKGDNVGMWWLRDLYQYNPGNHLCVPLDGKVNTSGYEVSRRDVGVRPALWLKYKI